MANKITWNLERLKFKMRESGLTSPEELAERLKREQERRVGSEVPKHPVSVAQLRKILTGKHNPGRRTRNVIEDLLGLFPGALSLSAPYEVSPNEAGVASHVKRRDLKNLVTDQAISEALLTGGTAPPLSLAVRVSRTEIPATDAEKSTPLTNVLPFNHFLQIAILLRTKAASNSRASLLCYRREPRQNALQHEHTRGMAALWGASFEKGLRERGLMDDWLDACLSDPERAEKMLLDHDNSLLFELFTYKDVYPGKLNVTSIQPLGVITNDQREGHQRVYSAYVFELIVGTPHGSVEGFAPPAIWYVDWKDDITSRTEAEVHFFDEKRQRSNAMDVLAWQALHTGTLQLKYATATFVRGFGVA